MKKIAITLLSIPLAALAFGCNKESGSASKTADGTASGSVAIVDLDKVAKSMGWTDEMTKNLQLTQASVAEQLKGLLKPGQTALENKRDEIAKAANLNAAQIDQLNNAKSRADLEKLGLTSKQIEELGQAFGTAYNENAAANQRLNQIVAAQRDKIVQTYREAVKPAVRRVALSSNKTVVLMPGGDLLYSDPSADISDKVVDDLTASKAGKVDLPLIPKLEIQLPPATTKSK